MEAKDGGMAAPTPAIGFGGRNEIMAAAHRDLLLLERLTQLGRRRRRRAPSGAPVIRRQPLRLPACTSGRGRAVVQMKGPLDVDLGDSFRPQDYVWAPAVRVGASHWTAAPDGLARVPGQVRTPTLGVRSFPFLHIPTGNNITRRHGP